MSGKGLWFTPNPAVTVGDVHEALDHSSKVESLAKTITDALPGVTINKTVRFADSGILTKRPRVRSMVSGIADMELTSPSGGVLYVNVNDTLYSTIDTNPGDWLGVHSVEDIHPVRIESPVKRATHQREALAAHDAGVELMQVYDWFDTGTVLDMIRSKFEMQPVKVFARNTEARIITQSEANAFLDKYHMQGGAKGQSYCVALFDESNGELLQVQTFGASRFDKSCEWEAIRLASKAGVVVVGGVSKGFSRFVHDVSPESVLSYVDADRSVGAADGKTGFSYVRMTTPTDVWFDPFGVDKTPYKDSFVQVAGIDKALGIPASDFPDYDPKDKSTGNTGLMLSRGYVRVPTSGSFVYKWERD